MPTRATKSQQLQKGRAPHRRRPHSAAGRSHRSRRRRSPKSGEGSPPQRRATGSVCRSQTLVGSGIGFRPFWGKGIKPTYRFTRVWSQVSSPSGQKSVSRPDFNLIFSGKASNQTTSAQGRLRLKGDFGSKATSAQGRLNRDVGSRATSAQASDDFGSVRKLAACRLCRLHALQPLRP
jgi:hypothetical protein